MKATIHKAFLRSKPLILLIMTLNLQPFLDGSCTALASEERTISSPHPVFGINSNQSSRDLTPTKEMYRQMMDKALFVDTKLDWEKDFGAIETTAASDLCRQLKNRSQNEVLGLLSNPSLKFGHQWLYIFGGNRILITLTFLGETCVSASFRQWPHSTKASAFGIDSVDTFSKWWCHELEYFAPGKSEAEIISFAGQPLAHSAPETVLKPSLQNPLPEVNNELFYSTGVSGTTLYFTNDVCVAIQIKTASSCITRKFTLGSRQHQPLIQLREGETF